VPASSCIATQARTRTTWSTSLGARIASCPLPFCTEPSTLRIAPAAQIHGMRSACQASRLRGNSQSENCWQDHHQPTFDSNRARPRGEGPGGLDPNELQLHFLMRVTPDVGTFRVWIAVNACAAMKPTIRISLPVGPWGGACLSPRQRQRLGSRQPTHDQRPRVPHPRSRFPFGRPDVRRRILGIFRVWLAHDSPRFHSRRLQHAVPPALHGRYTALGYTSWGSLTFGALGSEQK
jgi:hypothetical protein